MSSITWHLTIWSQSWSGNTCLQLEMTKHMSSHNHCQPSPPMRRASRVDRQTCLLQTWLTSIKNHACGINWRSNRPNKRKKRLSISARQRLTQCQLTYRICLTTARPKDCSLSRVVVQTLRSSNPMKMREARKPACSTRSCSKRALTMWQ